MRGGATLIRSNHGDLHLLNVWEDSSAGGAEEEEDVPVEEEEEDVRMEDVRMLNQADRK